MRLVQFVFLMILLISCGNNSSNTKPPTNESPLTGGNPALIGQYSIGYIQIQLDPNNIIASRINVTIAGDGTLTGTAITFAPSVILEQGIVKGAIIGPNETLTLDFMVDFPQMGDYSIKGEGFYDPPSKSILAYPLATKDSAGADAGSTSILWTKYESTIK